LSNSRIERIVMTKFAYLLSAGTGIATLLAVAQAAAVQPIGEFLAAARKNSFAAREQSATVEQRRAEEDTAFGRLLPSFAARGSYSYNQYEVKIPAGAFPGSTEDLVISPHSQLDATLTLDIPLLDLASRARHNQSKLLTEAAALQRDLIGVDLDRAVARAYASYIGTAALVSAAAQSIDAAQQHLTFVQTRIELGAATELERARAIANVERAQQDKTDAELSQALAGRQLQTLTGLTPLAVDAFPSDDLHAEAPLGQWLTVKDTASDKLQSKIDEVNSAGQKAATYAFLPTISANASERLTNATGFSGRAAQYTLQAVLSWRLDYGTYANTKVQDEVVEVQRVRSERARRDVEDAIFEAHQRITAGIAKSRSARAQVAAATTAANLAVERYQAGVATQIDVTQSQRDAFLASASQIQADTDLTYWRTLLRVAAGREVTALTP
jgi:outer membrane protein TolC